MNIHWETEKLKNQLENYEFLKSSYDKKLANKVVLRIQQLQSAPTYCDIPQSANKHTIKEKKDNFYFTVDLSQLGKKRGKLRLAFEPYGEYDKAIQKTITSIMIIGILDSHK